MKVLVLDDDPKSRTLLNDLLSFKKIDCVLAKDGAEALAKISVEIDFYILDLRLPDTDGYEVARRIKEKYPNAFTIAYTASVLQTERNKLVNTNLFDAVLEKPIQLKNFNEVIDAVVNKFLNKANKADQLVKDV